MRKPVIVKTYVCLLVSLSVKAVHIEPVADLTTDAFNVALWCFTAWRGKPSLILLELTSLVLSENWRIFMTFSANSRLKEIFLSLAQLNLLNENLVVRVPHTSEECGKQQSSRWSTTSLFKRIVGSTKLTFEELTTILTQIESYLNSRPLAHYLLKTTMLMLLLQAIS